MQAFLKRSRITILRQKCRSALPYLVGQRTPDLLRRLHWLQEIIIVRPVAFLPALYFSRQSSVFLAHKKREGICPPLLSRGQQCIVNIYSATHLLFVDFRHRLNIVDEGKKQVPAIIAISRGDYSYLLNIYTLSNAGRWWWLKIWRRWSNWCWSLPVLIIIPILILITHNHPDADPCLYSASWLLSRSFTTASLLFSLEEK